MMKNLLKLIKITAFIAVAFLCSNQKTYATHAMGAEITYKSLGNNTYEFTYHFYYDCSSPYQMLGSYPFDLQSTTCGFDTTINMVMNSQLSNIDVTPLCPNLTDQCTDPNSIYPGVKQYIYQATVNLGNHYCSDFIIAFAMNARNGNITTLTNAGATYLTVFALLNNTISGDNSPTFSIVPTPYICEGQLFCYNNGATDVDGDSLVYSLMTPLAGPSTAPFSATVTYSSIAYDSIHPIDSAPPVTFDSLNGTVCMTPSALDIGVMAILVKEYRNGVLIGEVERDIQINVINCTNNLPNLTGMDSTNNFISTICPQIPFCFQVYTSDLDVGQSDTIIYDFAIPGATFTETAGPRPVGTFCWTPPDSAANSINYCFTLKVVDNNCPYEGIQVYSYCIHVVGARSNFSHSSYCNLTVAFQDSSTIPVGTITAWHWNFGDPLSGNLDTTSVTNPTHTFTDTGVYSVQLITISSQGCADTITKIVHIRIGPSLADTSTNVTCNNANNGIGIVTVTSGGVLPFTYSWSPTGGTNATATGLGAGTYVVTVTDSVGCTKTDSVIITQPPPLVLDTVVNDIYCPMFTGNASVTASGGTGPYTYTWSPNVSTTTTASGLTVGTYTVSVSDGHGCIQSTSFNIFQSNSLGTIDSIVNISCHNGNNGSIYVNVTSSTGPFTYVWSPAVSTNSSATGLSAGNYTLTVTDTSNCHSILPFNMANPTAVSAIDSALNPLCDSAVNGVAIVFASGGHPNYTYLWSPTGGTAATASGLGAGTYTVLVTDSSGCTSTQTVTLTNPPYLSSTEAQVNALCFGDATGIASVTPSGGTPNYTYVWSPIGGTGSTATGLSAGNYHVTVTDSHGCTTVSNYLITQPPILIANDTPTVQVICAGDSAVIVGSATGGTPGYTYSWTGNGSTTTTITVNPGTSSSYTLTVTDAHGCTSTSTDSVRVTQLPVPVVTSDSICWGDTATLCATGGGQYFWATGQTTQCITFPFDTTMKILDSVYIIGNGCRSHWVVDSAMLNGPRVVAGFTPDSLLGYQPLIVLFTNNTSNGTFYWWNFGDTLSGANDSSTLQNPWHIYDSAGTYTVLLITENQFGCRDTLTKIIVVEKKSHLVISNIFTPNGDGRNDTWTPDFTNISSAHMMIYNRWGEKIKDWTTLTGWDGTTSGGSLCPDGTYYYIITAIGVDGVNYKDHGYITLIRNN